MLEFHRRRLSEIACLIADLPKSLLLMFLSPVHTSNNVEATLLNATTSNVASTLLLVWTGLYYESVFTFATRES